MENSITRRTIVHLTQRGNTKTEKVRKVIYNIRGKKPANKFSISEIEQEVNKLKKVARSAEGKTEIQIGFRTSALNHMFKPVILKKDSDMLTQFVARPQNVEYEEFLDDGLFVNKKERNVKNFWIIITQVLPKGGTSNGNNCLWRCLVKSGFKSAFSKPSFLRLFLRIPSNEPIDFGYTSKIEKHLNCGIFVSGDFERVPNGEFKQNIYLNLINGHYSINKKGGAINKIGYMSSPDRDIVIFTKSETGYTCFSGKGWNECEDIKEYEKKDYVSIQLKNAIKALIRNKDEKDALTSQGIELNCEWAYNELKIEITKIKQISNGSINMFRSGWITETIRHLINYFMNNRHIVPDTITPDEAEWIMNATTGSYFIKRSNTPGTHIKYDQRNSFPYILSLPSFNVPFKQGEFKVLPQIAVRDERPKFGIYRCTVEGGNPKFKYNKNNHYTNFDVTMARKLGLHVQLMEDGQPNALLYSVADKCMKGSQLYGEYVKQIYQLRLEHPECKLLKHLLSQIHGTLAEKIYDTKKIETGEEVNVELENNEIIYQEYPSCDGEEYIMKTLNLNKLYKTNHSRMFPFLLARQRLNMFCHFIQPHWEKIIEFRTDGGSFNAVIPEFENQSTELGSIVRK